jgi:hypothetical protein
MIALWLWACASEQEEPGLAVGGSDPGSTRVDCAEPMALQLMETLYLESACGEADRCERGYLDYIEAAADRERLIDEAALQAQLDQIAAGDWALEHPVEDLIPADELRLALLQAANLDELVAGLPERALVVHQSDLREADEGMRTRRLRFDDPELGSFDALLYLPAGGPAPLIIGAHGHWEEAEQWVEDYGMIELVRQGYALLAITSRVDGADQRETELVRALLTHGHSLVGLRAFEQLLARQFATCSTEVDGDRVGLIGHSGGAVTANLSLRLDPTLSAGVIDLYSGYYNVYPDEHTGEQVILCDTTPDLHTWSLLINDLSTASVPTLQVDYGYTEGLDGALQHFDATLGAEAR